MLIRKLHQTGKWPGNTEKKEIEGRKRNLYLIILIILLAAFSVGTAWSYTMPADETEEVRVYAYSQSADIDYLVHMKPNELFPDRVVGSDRAYITALAESLSTTLSYRFTGEREADIKGEYQSGALLSAYVGRGEERQLVWSKEYTLIPGKSISSDNGEILIEETVEVPLAEYLDFVDRVKTETGFTPTDLRLDIDYDINFSVEPAEGLMAEESVNPNLTVFLGGNTFTAGVENLEETNGGVYQERIVAVPWVSFARQALLVSSAVIALGLLGMLFLTTSKPEIIDSREIELAKIIKKHGERIVLAKSELSAFSDKGIDVTTFEELIKVADELGRPIVYHQPEANGNGYPYFFQVTTPEQIFSYTIEDNGARYHGSKTKYIFDPSAKKIEYEAVD